MDELLGDARDIEKIDENMIGAKWMNEMFLDFVFHYAIRVSKNRQFVISRLVQEDVSIFQCITASDVAWAVTCYVNNKEFWNTKINAKGGGQIKKRRPGTHEGPLPWRKRSHLMMRPGGIERPKERDQGQGGLIRLHRELKVTVGKWKVNSSMRK